MEYPLDTGKYTLLEITARKTCKDTGSIQLYLNGDCAGSYYFKYNGFETAILTLHSGECYRMELRNLDISLMYLSGSPDPLEDGVIYLELEESHLKRYHKENMTKAYNQSCRNQFHFSPYKNWMNDPNGLCYFKGCYHLFYQHNPNYPEWGNMHWGHAVSKDCIHWIHQPITFYPQIELLDNPDFRGGAFSGSAYVKEDTMYLFFTRHFGKQDKSWQRQWQMCSKTTDGIHFTTEEVVIWGTPEGVCYDFRDPKVSFIDHTYFMVLGGTVFGKPAVLAYTSDDLKTWEYKGVLHQETDDIYGISECPDFFPLGDQYVLIAGYIYSQHAASSPRRDTKYYIGSFSNGIFTVRQSGLMDLGKDFYAPQSFEHNGRRICIGWNCTGNNYYIHEKGSANGTASIPRELSYEDNTLYMRPIEEIKGLEHCVLFQSESCRNFSVHSPQEYRLTVGTHQHMIGVFQLARNQERVLELLISEQRFQLNTGTGDSCVFTVKDIKKLDIYVDRSLIEIFINDGADTCTRRYYLPDSSYEIVGKIHTDCRINITTLNSIW